MVIKIACDVSRPLRRQGDTGDEGKDEDLKKPTKTRQNISEGFQSDMLEQEKLEITQNGGWIASRKILQHANETVKATEG